ncbi:MAG: hypothetical protein COW18_04000 [Zetaproteobacteria bacterium CG12_big_fil_rev_8_21_14_0_65_54_13]|nr:MAG: hypothetical protein COX55_00745 [Zetaproteobacteria bacterium CG23_combo_of_CG06-09_8_20_14_all_54_7]PIW50275.1 MAG: hypothetical protein COW18_04000 [Zetaproteobacteria bacterium CG12_big_fil_rev_8_21_14_0_65_54_13]PIX54770.1 MAG: hypothetical protein COZ50_06200 [Zetaproteobacteria bacterium CG_4_10_14_3_um_filter_54_28]PJA29674.1 MAG: hypothetical protein CO188_06120 [Zetaproteobacteria bacterium CG_4_9_14_3_um_filter_54_145]
MSKTTGNANKSAIHNPEELRERISTAAYFLSEQRGFEGDCQLYDWLEAEGKIHHIYGKSLPSKQGGS